MSKTLTAEDYTVGWICPLRVEHIAALEMLDEEHERLPQPTTDHNSYVLGSVHGHNVVITGIPGPGNTSAATVVAQMRSTFPNIRFGLLVGIGGGVPTETEEGPIRLGDVIVSQPTGEHSGTVQYDHGKMRDGVFERTGALAPPPTVLQNAARNLAVNRARSRHDPLEDNIKRIDTTIRGLRRYKHPGIDQDRLYERDYIHRQSGQSCRDCGCDESRIVQRKAEDDDCMTRVHHGTIASGELVLRDAATRDEMAQKYGLLCFETEAAGALNDFPCLVIRGISDYCDSHKNDEWHGYASAAAAAYARQLFLHMPIDEAKRDISQSAETDIQHIRCRQDSREKEEVLNWVTTVDYGTQQSDYLRLRQPGTGQWLLDSPQYKLWLEADGQTLFCQGIPGAGKTLLTSIAIDEITTRFGNDNQRIGIAYVFCNFRRQDEQKYDGLLASLLKQLAQRQAFVPKVVNSLHDKHKAQRTRPTVAEVATTLRAVAALFSKVFILIDALDEYSDLRGHRTNFLAEIFGLQNDSACVANIFVTSRPIPEVVHKFKNAIPLEVRASDEDIQKYVSGRISHLPSFVRADPRLQENITAAIVQAVDGMFLLAQLHIDSLVGKRSIRAVYTALMKFPKGSDAYDQAYENAMERIGEQVNDQRSLALDVLRWISGSMRPFKTPELRHALAVEMGRLTLDPDKDLPDVADMVSVCAGLVVLDEESNIIRYPFYDYAAKNWGRHARLGTLPENLVEFLKKQKKRDASMQALMKGTLLSPSSLDGTSMDGKPKYQHYTKGMTSLHIVAFFGIVEATIMLLGSPDRAFLDTQDEDMRTPLAWAAKQGHDAVIELLLGSGAAAEYKWRDSQRQTPLSLQSGEAAEYVWGDLRGQTPLSLAAEAGHNAVVRRLLNSGRVDPNSRDTAAWTPLMHAAKNGHIAVVESLFDLGKVDVNKWDNLRRTNFMWAAKEGHYDIVKLLLESGRVRSEPHGGWELIPPTAAANEGHVAIVQLLLESGKFNTDAEDDDGHTPLISAAKKGQYDIVKLLLESYQVDPDQRSSQKRTPLSYAAEGGHIPIVELLLVSYHVEIDSRDTKGRTPFFWAARRDHFTVVRLLLKAGADPTASDIRGLTPLHKAVICGHPQVVELLVKHPSGGGIFEMDIDGRTAQFHAAWHGNCELLEILASSSPANLQEDRYGVTPLSAALRNGHDKAAKYLLGCGNASTGIEDEDLDQPFLWWAVKLGDPDVIDLILQYTTAADHKYHVETDSDGTMTTKFNRSREIRGIGATLAALP
ncbi:Uncharacterized protein TPAR_05909 [Tolypocladium paradoxum]|uniref:Nephrocystin 3-like N-terminal domain-containing protein n=1 Tax=Tolypocladium paradoxum TaxID=94208 RepID=A0A2S4KUN1_9HYPO|nr:Uncharacterized protein TPAR_05909 [Tolypocladium paradoxum]